jgi:hypothetical protein
LETHTCILPSEEVLGMQWTISMQQQQQSHSVYVASLCASNLLWVPGVSCFTKEVLAGSGQSQKVGWLLK